MDLSALPARSLLRWDLAVRLVLALLIPVVVEVVVAGQVAAWGLGAAMSAALVSFGNLGPDLSRPAWSAVAAVGVPVAVVLGALAARLPTGGVLLTFVLFTVHGAMLRAGLLAQVAWFPVAAGGMIAALLATPATDVAALATAVVPGSVLALGLGWLVPRVVPAPRLPVPAEALGVDTPLLRRMIGAPSWSDWFFPMLLGSTSAGLLAVTTVVTGGFKPYWAVLALVTVLAPSSAQTRQSAAQTVLASLAGVVLAAVVLGAGLPPGWSLAVIAACALVGAVLMLRAGLVSKALLTPLPVAAAVLALDTAGAVALGLRVVEYVVGALVGLGVVVVTEQISRHLWQQRPEENRELVG